MVTSTFTTSSARFRKLSGTVSRICVLAERETASFSVSRCWMLTAVITLIPASINSRTSSYRLRLRQLVHNARMRMPRKDCLDVHLAQSDRAVRDLLERDDFEITDKRRCIFTPMRLNQANDDIHALLPEQVGVFQHAVGLAYSGSGAKIDAQFTFVHLQPTSTSCRAGAGVAMGKVKLNVVPCPRRLSTETCPPSVSTRRRTSASPRPVPSLEVPAKRPKIVGRRSASIPRPESCTTN